ncbi:hypothetical protein TSTA_021580 [Talaromyces stipitatus ATCC 10500]|uniref:RRM domain-containing protein n=1 Tax=Talaromyces stipitatus (strain ATCC 10500 / CBS 375.48 / QM 6759 / NRRL 1006) TaxID=441959 RepID=B8MHC2_TALSN|nr:uncharacterized protein TSTA_021580 [Talaromyces stipitatus ATCC 10500]EED17101.1 hypothetical protein TSTA_021580 [Talaromyces stipitatus ATCC 10500]
MTMFPPPPSLEQQIEYPYYFPYSHPTTQIAMCGQPLYAESRYRDDQHTSPTAFLSQYAPSPNQYYHHTQQGYHVYGYGSRKRSLCSTGTSDMYRNTTTTTATYNGGEGIFSFQAGVHQMSPVSKGISHIIIDNIRPGIDIKTLQDHFRDAGHVLYCQINRYNNNNGGNGKEAQCNESSYPGQFYATATFATAEEAERAVGMYNGSELGGSRVVVRLDTEWDPFAVEKSNMNGEGGEGDWSRSQSYSLSFTTSNAPLASSVSSSTETFSSYSALVSDIIIKIAIGEILEKNYSKELITLSFLREMLHQIV